MKTLKLRTGVSVSYVGPDLNEGPLPAVFYFSLSAEDSLGLDPFNQPVSFLSAYPLRVFSMNIPGHGPNLPPTKALEVWAGEISSGRDVIGEFTDQISDAVDELHRQRIIFPNQVGAAGLSRGGFIALHAAAKIPDFQFILGFAPLTQLSYAKEFHAIPEHPLVKGLNLELIIPQLIGKKIRFYIGNRDHLVGTALCFNFAQALTEVSFEHKIRSPQVEMIISPSIGHKGHGTSTQIFHQGAKWMLDQLEVAHG